MEKILPRMGNIFEGSSDLTVLPCSSKGTVSTATRRWLELFGLPNPQELQPNFKLGQISSVIPFTGPAQVTKFVVFAASVQNDHSTEDVIESIAKAVGELTRANPDIRIVETPLLGTGAGGMKAEFSTRALARGFSATSSSDAVLYIFAFDSERVSLMKRALSETPRKRLWQSLALRPGLFGIGIDLKKLFGFKE